MDDSNARAAVSIFRGGATNFQLKQVAHEGFSGSSLWRVELSGEPPLCLKRWPARHPPPARLPWIHAVLRHLRSEGISFVPEPQVTLAGATICELAGSTWELMTWLPGSADFAAKPSPARLENAFRTLALLHHATAVYAMGFLYKASLALSTPALDERISRWGELEAGQLAQISTAVRGRSIPEIDPLAHRWLATNSQLPHHLLAQLRTANETHWMQQPAVRDLWSDHVLFQGDQVTGFIDFGAMRVDTRLTDIARLIGSLAGDDVSKRDLALAAYASIRPLNDQERACINLLDHTGVILSGWNWLQWLYLDGRTFPSLVAVAERLRHLLGRKTLP